MLESILSGWLTVAKAQQDIPGVGWLDYDKVFCKQAADNPAISWSTVDPTLYLSTVLTMGAQTAWGITPVELDAFCQITNGRPGRCFLML